MLIFWRVTSTCSGFDFSSQTQVMWKECIDLPLAVTQQTAALAMHLSLVLHM